MRVAMLEDKGMWPKSDSMAALFSSSTVKVNDSVFPGQGLVEAAKSGKARWLARCAGRGRQCKARKSKTARPCPIPKWTLSWFGP